MLTSRKPATIRKPSWARRGVVGAAKPIAATPTHHATNSHSDQLLIVSTAKVTSPAWAISSQIEPRSAPRSELKVQNSFHWSGPVRYAGALASSQTITAELTTVTSWASSRRRTQMTRIAPSRNSG